MRVLAAAILLCLSIPAVPALADGGPDSIYVPGKGYVERWERPAPVKRAAARKPKTAKIAGHSFRQTPNVVSWHSDAAPWLAAAKADVGKSAHQLGVPPRLWCADATNKWLRDAGYRGTGSRAAKSFLRYGTRTAPRPGAIAVYHRKGGGHVAVVEKVEGGTVTLVSGNCGRAGVCRYTRSVGSAIAYIWPEA